jgi:hypothetical protein
MHKVNEHSTLMISALDSKNSTVDSFLSTKYRMTTIFAESISSAIYQENETIFTLTVVAHWE